MIYSGITFLGLADLSVALTSLTICTVIFCLKRHLPRLSGRPHDLKSVQAMHTRLTPRVGGLAIFGALLLSLLFAPEQIADRYTYFILATSILFVIALLEDLGVHMSAQKRLLAAVTASLVAIVLLDVWIPRADIPGLDFLLNHWVIGVPMTLVVTAGVSNAFNMIDGVNGLSALTAISAALALSHISYQADYIVMVHLATTLAAAVFGFLLVNYPFGLIFLGDAGAYTLGFVLSWFGISILLNAPEVSPWALLLTMFWPVADMCLAIYRRSRRRADAMAPDRLHVHQMVMRALEICVLGRKRRKAANPLTTLVLSPFVVAPPIAGVMFWDQSFNAFLSVIFFALVFTASYLVAPKLIHRFRQKIRLQ
ncbi:MraY family glycosyltransferase [Tritonibacter mobilis]|uniref:MraY family glycosyltransferase n=1 Tax=Tritonibacter mobilis TaxID=379347 RepID=UPI0013B43014|nr:glycosyltransferase [Tritonibacter mobilis]